jgi:hypothetical protein
MPAIDLSILNQRQTPAFYADTLANRPAAGFVGRIFVSTDTFAFYRDNGTTWDLIGGPGTGTVTGPGANGQVTYWNGASTITGSNDLFFDAVNGHLGIGTVTPGTALDVKHDQSTVVQLEQITATNDIRIAFINSGVGLWRLGAFYNAGANDFGLFDIAAATQPVTVKRTTGQVLIGTSTVGSGKLVVASSTGDNGVQIVGAAAPSLRIDNAESGPTKRAGLGISTAANNFIQGSVDRDFCIFNGSTTASPILFGIYNTTNVAEAARISAARNFLIGTTTDAGYKLNVNGTAYINNRLTIDGTATNQYIQFFNSGTDRAHIYWNEVDNSLSIGTYVSGGSISFETNNNIDAMFLGSNGFLGLGTNTPAELFTIYRNAAADNRLAIYNGTPGYANAINLVGASNNGTAYNAILSKTDGSATAMWQIGGGGVDNTLVFYTAGSEDARFSSSGNLLIGTTTDIGAKLHASGNIIASGTGSANGLLSRDNNNSTAYGFVNNGSGSLTLTNSGVGNVGSFNMSTGIYTPTSDKNKKKNFEQSNVGLEAVLKLKPTLYNMISQSNHEAKELGFIAQEVKEVIEQAYVQNGEFIGLNYQPIIAALVKAIQDLNNKIENLKN